MKTPEQLADEYAYKFPVHEWESDNREDLREAFLAGYAAAQRWISVEEELPEQGTYVLAIRNIPPSRISSPLLRPNFFDENYFCVVNGTYIHQERQFFDDSDITVTHWQPLPPLPIK